jgi:hypothetical protein
MSGPDRDPRKTAMTSLPTSPCRGCGRKIVWGLLREADPESGGEWITRVPLDPTPACYLIIDGNTADVIVVRQKAAMVSHFATCPKASAFTRRRR